MAAPVTTTATTLEAQLVEVAKALGDAEQALSTPVNNLSINLNEGNGTIAIQVTLPATFAQSAGQLTATPTEYIV